MKSNKIKNMFPKWFFWNVSFSYRNRFTTSLTDEKEVNFSWLIFLGYDIHNGGEYANQKNRCDITLTVFNQDIIIKVYDINYSGRWGI